MYYVLFVGAGKESQAESFIKAFVPDGIYSDCFHPLRHMQKKIRGEVKDVYSKLIPGYVFVESDRIEDFCMESTKIPLFLKLLGKEDEKDGLYFQALSENETGWLKKLMQIGEQGDSLQEGSVPYGKRRGLPQGGLIQNGKRSGSLQDGLVQDRKQNGLDHVVELSQVGFDENDQVYVIDGPLKDMQGQVKKINLHKRIAEVEIEFLGRKTIFHLGIKILDQITN